MRETCDDTSHQGVHSVVFWALAGFIESAQGQICVTSDPTSHDTACGSLTLRSSGSNSDNTALGFEALFSLQTGNDNTALGFEALESNVDGADNTASGFIGVIAGKQHERKL